jgi:hypothetical protein
VLGFCWYGNEPSFSIKSPDELRDSSLLSSVFLSHRPILWPSQHIGISSWIIVCSVILIYLLVHLCFVLVFFLPSTLFTFFLSDISQCVGRWPYGGDWRNPFPGMEQIPQWVSAIAPLSHVGWRTLTTSAPSLGQSSLALFTLLASWQCSVVSKRWSMSFCPNFGVLARPEIMYEGKPHSVYSCSVIEVTPDIIKALLWPSR